MKTRMRDRENLSPHWIVRSPTNTPTTDIAKHKRKLKIPYFFVAGLMFVVLLFSAISFVDGNGKEKHDISRGQYEKILKWYNHQLDYYDMLEISVHDDYIMLYDKNRESFSIQLTGDLLSYPRNMPRGYAKKLLSARMLIMKYERTNGFKRTQVNRIIPGHPSHQGL